MADIKFSAFTAAGALVTTDTLVGLRAGANSKFTLTATPTASAVAGWDSSSNLSANNFLPGFATTATAVGTTTLTVASKHTQEFTGATTQIVTMPVTSTLALGQSFLIINNSSGAVTVNSSGANAIQIMAANTSLLLTCILISGTTAASWNAEYSGDSGGVLSITGTANQVIASAATGAVTLSLPQSIATGSSPTFVTETLSGLTASQAVVTDGSKVLASLAYTTTATASALTQRDSNANDFANRYNANSNVESLSATKTLVVSDAQYQFLDPNGADRTVQLPTAVTGMLYIIKNTGSAGNNLTVQNASAVQVGNPISNNLVTGFYYQGSAWSTV